MRFDNLIKCSNKNYKKINVKGIAFDSKKVKKGDIFFSIKGKKTAGNKFINEALSNGALAIVSNKKIKYKNNNVPFVLVKNVREKLTQASSNFYKNKPKNIVAVTGTNGKSSVADFFYQILSLNKIPVASIGTLGINSKKYKRKTDLTSLDPLTLHKGLDILAKNNINNVILEASSHGLEQRRLDHLDIKTGIFTNLSHDHLDYHQNIKSYFDSKMYLFKKLLTKKSKIISDEEIKEFTIIKNISNRRKIKKITIGKSTGDIKIVKNKYKGKNQIVKILCGSKFFILEIPLIGFFQVKNLLMAILAASTCGLSKNIIFDQVKKIKPVSGRLECIKSLNNNSDIILDFAHTPDALEQSLIALKKQFNKEIIIVFGCGGERDKKKRYLMGKIAKKYCRKIFITDDNPRNENPKKIRNDILKGSGRKALNIGNRKEAIKAGINELGSNEILLVAGKGHEKIQDYGKFVIKFSDKKVIRNIINKKNNLYNKYKHKAFLIKKAFPNIKNNNINFKEVSINSKNVKKRDIFFAIKGKNTDGHKFVKEAFKKGAIRSVVENKINGSSKAKIIKVKNTLNSLNDLAKINRRNTSAEIIGITGSAGKTTLKNLLSFALKYYGKVYSSPHSYNNKFGVPLSLSNLKNDSRYGVFEVGMDKKGEIKNLSKIIQPEIGVITNIAGAHFKNFKTLKDIAKAKAEIIDNISHQGTVVLNKDSNFFSFLCKKAKKCGINVTSFSLKQKADVSLKDVKKINNFYRIKVIVRKQIYYFNTLNITNSFISNILACLSVLVDLNLDLAKLRKKFIKFSIPRGRGDIKIIKKFKKKFKFIDESYNANPLSMRSSIENVHLFKIKNKAKKLVFLGDMLELGKKSKKFHRELSRVINKSNIDKVFVYGKDIKLTFNFLSKNKKGKVFNKLSDAYNYFSKIINNNDLLMVKGSHATKLNQFSKNIKGY